MRAGRLMRGFRVAESARVVEPPRVDAEAWDERIADTMDEVVCSRVCSASTGALATYIRSMVSIHVLVVEIG